MRKLRTQNSEVRSQRIIRICFLSSVLCFLSSACYAQEAISSAKLIENAQYYDGQAVTYEGEVIGELMKRKDGVWANIHDDEHSIGVWLSAELAGLIKHTGSYKVQGDVVQIQGTFHQACPMHGGDLDIHAISLDKIKSGWQIQEKMIPAKRNLLIILAVILCLILIFRILLTK